MGTAASVPLDQLQTPVFVVPDTRINDPFSNSSLTESGQVVIKTEPTQSQSVPTQPQSPQSIFAFEEQLILSEIPQISIVKQETGDGYKWRKYGSKKGKDVHRSYFKCRHAGCTVKKVTEISTIDSNQTENVTYKGDHNHAPPIISHVIAETNAQLHSHIVQYTLQVAPMQTGNSSYEPKLVVNLPSVLNPQEDGFSWRKYGQKTVKGSPHPRSYFKCTTESCNVKKQIELEHDRYICTYEGLHNHDRFAVSEGTKRYIQDTNTQESPQKEAKHEVSSQIHSGSDVDY